ncbi:accessory gene regulator B family protein [Oscillibacter sp.]|uniref:accessory gene regulator B family protein n=1 Tax=Oscillibacter sp. TaxID=1945593 RepID=UPI0028AE5B0B|nr:accessory gene regulator B family protein [Oscillibacter sp.]
MISELSQKISAYLIENGADHEEEEVLAYGAECFLNLLISDGLLLVIGLLTHHVVPLLIWAVSFSLLRANLGGLHALSHFWCILIGTGIGASSLVISPVLAVHPVAAVLCTIAGAIVAIVIAPVPHKNKKHIQAHRKKLKVKVAITAAIECVMMCVFYFIDPMYAAYFACGLIMAVGLGVAGTIWNPR